MTPRLVALVWLWLGAALLFVAVVAPAAFAVLPSRALAGLVVGRVLPVLFWSGALVALVLIPGSAGWRRSAAAVLLVSSLGAQLGIAPRIQRLRVAMGADIEALAPTDERRLSFGRMHALSVALLGVGMFGAASIALASVWTARAGAPQAVAPHRTAASSVSPRA